MSGDHNMYQKTKSYLDDFECPRCGHCCQALEEKREPLYWSVADGWVYADDTSQERVDEKAKREHEWVWLTDEEIQDLSYLAQKIDEGNAAWFDRWGFARAIEQALKEKNNG